MRQKTTLLDQARRLETRIRVKRETKKQLKQQYYKIFLHENTGVLPSKKKLKRWRRNFTIAAVISLMIPAIQTTMFYNTTHTSPSYIEEDTLEQILQGFIRDIPLILGLCFFMFSFLTLCVEWVIYRRWPWDHTVFSQIQLQHRSDRQRSNPKSMMPNQKPTRY